MSKETSAPVTQEGHQVLTHELTVSEKNLKKWAKYRFDFDRYRDGVADLSTRLQSRRFLERVVHGRLKIALGDSLFINQLVENLNKGRDVDIALNYPAYRGIDLRSFRGNGPFAAIESLAVSIIPAGKKVCEAVVDCKTLELVLGRVITDNRNRDSVQAEMKATDFLLRGDVVRLIPPKKPL